MKFLHSIDGVNFFFLERRPRNCYEVATWGGGGDTPVPEHIIFTNFQKIRSGASPFYIFGGFCRSGDHHFQNFFNFNPFIASHGRLSPNAERSAAPRVSQTRPGSSGDWHFHAQNGSSSFRSPVFSSSTRLKLVPEPRIFKLKRLKLVPEPRIFTLDWELVPEPLPIFSLCRGKYLPKFGVSTPPPPPPPGTSHSMSRKMTLHGSCGTALREGVTMALDSV